MDNKIMKKIMKKIKSGYQLMLFVMSVMIISSAHGESYYYPSNSGNSNKVIRHACRDRIRENIWSDHRYIQKVEFTRGSFNFWRQSKNKTGMKGRGKFLNRKSRWKEFSFTCSYNHRRDEVVNARYTKSNSDSSHPGYNYDARRACKHEIDRKVLNQHESASRIRWDERSVTERRESRHETSFSGSGNFIGGRGKYREYGFKCIYDRNQDDVRKAWVEVYR